MNRDGHNNARFFIGPEVEHTPAFNKRTLFVVGKQPVADIVQFAREQKTTHIFMGANHSFAIDGDPYWDKAITELLDRGFWVSLDYEAHLHGEVLKMLNKGIWQSRIFVPMLSIRIPYLQTSSQNLTLKFDDVDFMATNAGVWCLNHHEVTDSNRFTDWTDYGTDEVLATEDTLVSMPLFVEPLVVPAKPADITKPTGEPIYNLPTDKNDGSLGLDTVPKTPADAVVEAVTTTPADAAEAYAEGAKPPKKTGKK